MLGHSWWTWWFLSGGMVLSNRGWWSCTGGGGGWTKHLTIRPPRSPYVLPIQLWCHLVSYPPPPCWRWTAGAVTCENITGLNSLMRNGNIISIYGRMATSIPDYRSLWGVSYTSSHVTQLGNDAIDCSLYNWVKQKMEFTNQSKRIHWW